MRFADFYRSLSKDERASFAERSSTTVNYIEIHLLAAPERRKTPREKLMRRLVEASNGKVSFEEVLAHFYQQESAA